MDKKVVILRRSGYQQIEFLITAIFAIGGEGIVVKEMKMA